ncbi:exosome complex component RRP42-like [Styela clava]
MAIAILGDAEKRFIIHGIQEDLRNDGRGCEDYRHIDLEVNLVSNTNGSSRLRIGNTELLVGVKLDLEMPLANSPDQGLVDFNIDCSPNATPQFQGRGGEDLAATIKSLLTRAYNNNLVLDLKSLCIVPGKNCWSVHVDVLILECGGNLLDAVSIAVFAALFDTSIPKLGVTEGDEGEVEINLPDDPLDSIPMNVTNCPIFVTLSKAGQRYIIDATAEEEACCLASVILSIMKDGRCTALRKDGSGSLDPQSISEMLDVGKRVGMNLHKSILKFLKNMPVMKFNDKTGFL